MVGRGSLAKDFRPARRRRRLFDALGEAISLCLSGGQAHDLIGADHLLPSMTAEMLLADKAYDADKPVIDVLRVTGKTAVIPSKSTRKVDRG
jgi:transposase